MQRSYLPDARDGGDGTQHLRAGFLERESTDVRLRISSREFPAYAAIRSDPPKSDYASDLRKYIAVVRPNPLDPF